MGGTAAALPFGLSTKVFADFESSMARVKALTNASEKDFAALTEQARKMGRETVFTSSQAAQAMSFFALAGFKVSEIMQAIEPTLQLAAAGQIEIAQAADISAKIMRSMGIEAGRLGEVVDVMAKAMTTANTDMLMLGDAFKFVGPIAKTAGVPLEDITAAIQLLSDAGIQGEMAGTTLRGMLLSLNDAAKAPALAKLGVRVKDAAGNMRPLADIIEDFQLAVGKMGSSDQLGALGSIFDNRQAAGAAVLVSEGADRLRAAVAALQDSSGTGARISATQLDTLAGSWKILESALEDVAITIGGALSPVLRKWAGNLQIVANVVSHVLTQNPEFVVGVAKVIAVAVGAGAALVALGAGFKLAAFFGGVLATTLGLILSPIGLITAALVAGVGAWGAWTAEGQASLGHLGLLWDDLKATAIGAWGGIVDAVQSGDIVLAGRIAMAGLDVAWAATVNRLSKAWLEFTTFFQSVWEHATTGIAKGFNVLWTEFRLVIRKMMTEVRDNKVLQLLIPGLSAAMSLVPIKSEQQVRGEGAAIDRELDADLERRLAAVQQGKALNIEGMDKEVEALKQDLEILLGRARQQRQAADARAFTAGAAAKKGAAAFALPGLSGGGGGGESGTFSAQVASRIAAGQSSAQQQAMADLAACRLILERLFGVERERLELERT